MRIDRNAAAIVGDGHKTVRLHLDIDPVGVAGERLVHGIVDHFGEQVMQRLFVGAADIHARAAAHRLEPFQDLDVFGRVAGLSCAARRSTAGAGRTATRRPRLAEIGKQIGCLRRLRCFGSFAHAEVSTLAGDSDGIAPGV